MAEAGVEQQVAVAALRERPAEHLVAVARQLRQGLGVRAAQPAERRRQDELHTYVENRIQDEQSTERARGELGRLRGNRDKRIAEIRRILKPGGEFLFLEHGLAPVPTVARWQRRLTPIQRRLGGGCHLDRDTVRLVTEAGLPPARVEHYYLRGVPRFAGYMSEGYAVRT